MKIRPGQPGPKKALASAGPNGLWSPLEPPPTAVVPAQPTVVHNHVKTPTVVNRVDAPVVNVDVDMTSVAAVMQTIAVVLAEQSNLMRQLLGILTDRQADALAGGSRAQGRTLRIHHDDGSESTVTEETGQ